MLKSYLQALNTRMVTYLVQPLVAWVLGLLAMCLLLAITVVRLITALTLDLQMSLLRLYSKIRR